MPIVEGGTKESSFGSWPWVAVLGQPHDDGNFTVICGGTLVGNQHIATAAHCFPTEEGSDGDNSKAITHVRLGDYDLASNADGSGTDVAVCAVS